MRTPAKNPSENGSALDTKLGVVADMIGLPGLGFTATQMAAALRDGRGSSP
jgi:hypothetical protein